MVNAPHQFKRPLSDAILSGALIAAVIVIGALPALAVLARGIR